MSVSGSRVCVRYENESNNWFFHPFEIGFRHLKVASCDGKQSTLINFAKERIIYRPIEGTETCHLLTLRSRIHHLALGIFETLGYLTLVVPFLVATFDRIFHKPWYIKGCEKLRTHIEEGGQLGVDPSKWRKNPFHSDCTNESFYQGASWIRKYPDMDQ